MAEELTKEEIEQVGLRFVGVSEEFEFVGMEDEVEVVGTEEEEE